jgi:RHS repeat-associated protein
MERRMTAKSLIAGIGVVLAILGFAWPMAAQTAPGVFADAVHPAGAPDPEKLDQIWQVDPITGSVSITIPFTTTPAGGRGPKIPFSLHYNSSSTVTLQYDFTVATQQETLTPIPITLQFYGWSTGQIYPTNTSPPQSPLGPWTTSGPFFYDHSTIVPGGQFTYYLPNGPVYTPVYTGCTIGGPYIYTDANGAAHDMNLETDSSGVSENMMQQCIVANSANATYGYTYSTTDGSALATALFLGGPNVLQPDGTQVFWANPITLEDSNGNQATYGPNVSGAMTATDSLGRTAFSTTIPIGSMGQIPVGNYNVTTTGASGSSESYSVVFSQISIGSFTMPHPISGPVGSPTSEMQGNNTSLGAEQPTTGDLNTKLPVVSSITLPDSTQYTFTYDPTYGTISKIVFPTGGYVRFVWGIRGDGGGNATFLKLSTLVVTEACTSTGSGAENCWQYSYQDYSSTTGLSSTVTAPDGSYTNYNSDASFFYSVVPVSGSGVPSWKETSRLEYNSSGTLMKSVATNYWTSNGATGLPYQVATTLYDGPTPLQQYVQYAYDFTTQVPISYYTAEYQEELNLQGWPAGTSTAAVANYNVSYGNVVEKDESDFYPCTISGNSCPMPTTPPSFLRKTLTSYAYANNPAMAAAHIVDKPSQVLVTDGSGNPAALTIYAYDETGHIGSTPSGLSTHDDVNYGPGSTLPRGNMTTETRCITITGSGSNATCGSSLQTSYYYDLTGQLTKKTEGFGTSAAATTQYTWGEQNSGFLTQVQHADGTTEQYTYWQPIGAMATHTDVNNQTTTFSYESYLNRIASIVLPSTMDGTTGSAGNGGTIYTYSDTPGAFSVQEKHPVDTAGTTTSVTKTYDGLGRAVTSSIAVPATQCSSGTLFTQTTYDSMSRVYSVSNPYCSTSDPTYGLTYFAYDGLGRKTQTTLPDGSVSKIAYAGNATMTTDPFNGTTNVQHVQQSDGLGRLTNVCEVGLSPQTTGGPQACGLNIAGSGSLTTYSYDPLGNMLSVNQHGLGRTFSYDSISRLLCASNPENSFAACPATDNGAYVPGTDGYTYSNSSNACSPSAGVPCTRTDARGVMTSYAYDNMSRLTSKSYSAASGNTTGGVSDLTSCYLYGLTKDPTNNTGGRLIAEWMQSGSCASSAPSTAVGVRYHPSYDAMGRLLADQQCLTGASCSATTGNFVYTYNLLGNPVQSNNGIFASTVTATQTATQNTTPIAAPSITWKTTYDIADHINYVGIQDQPSTSVLPASTYSFAPTLLLPTSYDPFSHLTGAQLGIPNGSSTQAINILRQYDNRGRIVNEMDGGLLDASPATGSMGFINVSGAEKARYSSTATSGSAVISVTGADGSHTVCTTTYTYIGNDTYVPVTNCNSVSDTGYLGVTINGFTSSASYDSSSSDSSIAASLAAGFNASGSPVTAFANGNFFTVTAVATGPSSNYPIAFSSSSSDFSLAGAIATLAGGHRGGCMAYDTGTVTALINNASGFTPFSYTASASWGQNDTPATLAAKLAASINSTAGSVVTATPSGSAVNLLSNITGAASNNFVLSVSVSDGMGVLYPYLAAYPSFQLDAENPTGGAAADSNYGTIYSYAVPQGGYAPNGNILAHTDSVMGDWVFSYDAMDRLTAAAAGGAAPSAFQGQNAAWSYDSFGNRTAQSFTNGVYSNWANYNPANNQITTASSALAGYVYDASGNTLNDGNNRYWYDAEGQLCAVQSLAVPGLPITQYVYDAEGARIAKGTLSAAPALYTSSCTPFSLDAQSFTLTTRYLVDLGGNQVTELSEQGLPAPATELWKHSNVFSAARLTATYDYNYSTNVGGLHYELADPLGTKRVQANISGQIETSWASLPFGDALTPILPSNPPPTADDATEHHFTQKERDNESGNDYFFARYYNSAIGRFTTPDWSAKGEPVPYAVFTDPQSLNLYAYVRNNPITGLDPHGHMDCSGKNANGIGCQYMAARQWIASAGMAPGATLGETFGMAANITGAVLAQYYNTGGTAQDPYSNHGNTSIILGSHTNGPHPMLTLGNGDYHTYETDWYPITLGKNGKLGAPVKGAKVGLMELFDGTKHWQFMGEREGHGEDSIQTGPGIVSVNQHWYVNHQQVQLLVGMGEDNKPILTWEFRINRSGGQPVYSPVP